MKTRAYWWFKHVLIGPWLRIYNRPYSKGVDKLPADGPVIFASNHLAVMDSFYFPLLIDRQLTFLAKREYFTNPGLVGRIQKWFFSTLGQVPIDRSDRGSQEAALQTALRLLKDGNALGMYPEGTRSPDGRLYRGKTGMARIALESGVKIFPVAMIDSDKANPIGSWIPRPHRVGFYIGDSIDPEDFRDAGDDYDQARALTNAVMEALAKLGGQEYVEGHYAADVKNALAEGKGYPEGSAPGEGVVYK